MRLSPLVSLFVLLAAFIKPASADSLVTAVLPSSRSAVEGHLVTVFSTVINTSGEALRNCSITHTGDGFSNTLIDFALTDPSTNQIVGNKDIPFSMAVGASQSMVLEITSQDVNAGQLRPVVGCSGAVKNYSSTTIDGLNTILFSSGQQATPDVIALVASPSADGVLRIQGNGANAFAVAVSNVGSAGTITASVDNGDIQLPLTTSICQTNSTGQCLQSAASTTSLSLAANATASFAVFVQATGPIPFNPAGARIFVRFSDSGSSVRGATSVAVTNAPSFAATLPKGGLYSANFPFGTSGASSNPGLVFLAEDGEIQGADTLGNVISGNLSVGQGLTLTGTTLYVPASGASFSSAWQGTLGQRGWFSAEVSTTVNSSDTFQFGGTYQASAYERSSSLAAIAGIWYLRDDSGIVVVTVTVASDGSFSSSSPGSSCSFSGQISLIDTRYDLYRMTVNFSGCSPSPTGATSFTGLTSVLDDQTVNDAMLYIGSNTGAQASTGVYLTRY